MDQEEQTNDASQDVQQSQAAASVDRQDVQHVLPWERRSEIGRFKAYWQTVFHVLRRNGRLGQYMNGPVDYRSSRRFRWITIALAAVPFLFLGIVAFAEAVFDSWVTSSSPNLSSLWVFAIGWAFLLVVWALGAGIVSLFFCPRRFDTEHQNRAIALCGYTCAPLALMVFAVVPLSFVAYHSPMVSVSSRDTNLEEIKRLTVRIASGTSGNVGRLERALSLPGGSEVMGVCGGVLALYWYQLVLFGAGSIARRKAVGIVLAAVLLPVLWFLIYEAVFTWLPASVLMWLLIGPSLT